MNYYPYFTDFSYIVIGEVIMFESFHFGIIDIAMIVIVVLFGISGFKNGFLKDFKGVLAFLGALILSYFLAGMLHVLLISTPMQTFIYNWLGQSFFVGNTSYEVVIDATIPDALTFLVGGLTDIGIPDFIATPIADILITFNGTIGEALATVSTNLIMFILSYIVIFLVLWVLFLLILGQIVSLVKTVMLFKLLDQFLGVLLGIARAGLIIAVFFALVIPLSFAIPAINDFLTSDLALGTEAFSIGKFIFEFAIELFGNIL
jgi:uncharacterized membrane protein required for colicin V production